MDENNWFGFRLDLWYQIASILFLMTILIPAAIGDYQRQKIPNGLSMSGWVVGPVLGFIFAGSAGLVDALLGLSFMVGLMFPLWMIHWFGAADVKLLGSVGAVVGLSNAPETLLGVMLTGLVTSLLVLLFQRRLLLTFHEFISGHILKSIKFQGEKGNAAQELQRPLIPYAIPIAFGTMLSLLYLQL